MMLQLRERLEHERTQVRAEMAVRVTFNLSTPSDQWLRAQIAGAAADALSLQSVIVQGMDEADRIVAALSRLKAAKGLPYGGSSMQRQR